MTDDEGVRRIPVETPSGTFEVWTRRVGEHPTVRILMLHGGPGATHEYLLPLEEPLVAAGYELYFYDQLGSHLSDQPDDPSLWEIDRFVDEVEQVRLALGLDRFVLYGQSWGGMLGIEYALAHPEPLAGLVISNMMASIPAYNAYAEQVLMPAMDQDALVEIRRMEAAGQTGDPAYDALLMEHYYVDHICRMPLGEWPADVVAGLEHINHQVYDLMNGPSELGAIGSFKDWDRTADLGQIDVPTLVMGATHDTMDPEHLRWMADQLPQGSFHLSPDGSHIALADDHDAYVAGLLGWLGRLESASL
jgi:proline iminopeptidase